MQQKCGKCRQFTRTPENQTDLCGAWGQPTTATRAACEFFIGKKRERQEKPKEGYKSPEIKSD